MMSNKEKFNIIYKHFAKPISDMQMKYSSSALTVEAGVIDSRVNKCFDNLMRALNRQLDVYRNRR